MTGTATLHNIILTLPAHIDDARAASFAPELTEEALAFSAMRDGKDHRADWTLTWLVDGPPDAARVAALLGAEGWRSEPVADINWLEHSYRQFAPFTVGGFYICGSHYDGAVPADKHLLRVDAATAFGSGEHGTTAGCLRALEQLKDQGFAPASVLDMGTGSGILAIAAARLWDAPVTAVDIDPEAVVVCGRHAALNGVAERIAASSGDGFTVVEGTFDLVIANILAGPLIAMSKELAASVTPGGRFVLSGMLTEQAAGVAACYRALGCALDESFIQEPWAAQSWRRAA